VRVLVLGDSIADTLGQGLEQDAGRWGAKVFDMGFIGCDLDPDSTVNNEGFIGPPPQGAKVGSRPGPRTWPCSRPTSSPSSSAAGRCSTEWSTAIGRRSARSRGTTSSPQSSPARSKRSRPPGRKWCLFTTPFVDPPNLAPNGQPWDSNLPSSVAAYNHLPPSHREEIPPNCLGDRSQPSARPGGPLHLDPRQHRGAHADDEHLTPAGGELLRPEVLPQLVDMGRQHEARRTAELAR